MKKQTKIDFRYGIDYTYDIEKNCGARRCVIETVCRCRTIIDLELQEIDFDNIKKTILNTLSRKDSRTKDAIFLYCLERFVSRYQLTDFEAIIRPGYYGEEIEGVYLTTENELQKFLSLQASKDWIEFILIQEYGYLLDHLKDRTWESNISDLKDITLGNEYRRLDRDCIEFYRSELKEGRKKTLSCITDSNFRLVDGYHRYTASLEEERKTILTIRPIIPR